MYFAGAVRCKIVGEDIGVRCRMKTRSYNWLQSIEVTQKRLNITLLLIKSLDDFVSCSADGLLDHLKKSIKLPY